MSDRSKKKRFPAAAAAAVLLLFVAVALLFVGGRQFYDSQRTERLQAKEEQEQRALYETVRPEDGGEEPLEAALAFNARTVAWLTIPDTPIDLPVMQGEDNDFYLRHNFEDEESSLGAPFLDYRCQGDFSGFNSIVYGHHITKNRMFTPLESFKEEEYFASHTWGRLTTRTAVYRISFLACLVVESDSFIYESIFLTEGEKEEYLEQIRAQADCLRDFSPEELKEERLLVLSTCSYEFENARTVLIGYLEELAD